jgi:hypothetical protein
MPENSTLESTWSFRSAAATLQTQPQEQPHSTALRRSKLEIGLAFVVLAVGSTACGASEPTDAAAIGKTQEGITGGNLASNNNDPFGSAVKLAGCSGTKIGPRMFLTAGHCSGFVMNPQRAANGGTQVTVDNSLAGSSPTSVGVDRFYMHPAYTGPYTPGVDAAVLFISQDTPSIPTMAVDTASVPDGVGLPILGYGCDDRTPAHGGQKQWSNFVTLSMAQLQVMRPDLAATYPQRMYYDGGPFDGDYRQVCSGDSGGPAVRNFADQYGSFWKVTGITIQKIFDVTTHRMMSVSTRTGPIAAWLITPTLGAVHGTVTNVLSGMCLSGAGAVTSGSPVTLEVCDATTTASGTQFWSVFNSTLGGVVKQQLQNGKSGLCLDGGTVAGATSLTMSTCATVQRQRWTLTASATTPSEMVQELTGQKMGALASGVDLFTSESANRQRWLIAP